ncbi:MAG: sugar kinase [Spirochaetales bacterium]|nr:sugar kinase [Spirochaetales bacterium]
MERLTENKIILVTGMTRLEYLLKRFNSVDQAKFYVEHLGADFNDYIAEHDTYHAAFDTTMTVISRIGRLHVVQREFLPNFLFGKDDIIVALGRDGLVANTLKYLDGQPCFGVNPDPHRWDGILLPFTSSNLYETFISFFENKRTMKEVSMAKATLQNGECLYGVNDLFVGAQTHVSARYSITYGDTNEKHSSSGIIISTGLGSTAWLKSIITGATKIVDELSHTGTRTSLTSNKRNQPLEKMTWDADYLYFSVREPFPSITSSTNIVFGKVTKEKPLIISSLMPDYGVIFSDGIQQDFISFTSGTEAVISIAEKKGRLVV